tara:strand:+ start:306 stop:1181 length:876 start_codon:yes stop_codon:yes gene_type:complete
MGKSLKFIGIILLSTVISLCSNAKQISETLVLNKGTFTAADSTQFPYYAFNNDTTFSKTNKRLVLLLGDTLNLSLQNNSLDTHAFIIKSLGINLLLAPNSKQQKSIYPSAPGVFTYSDSKSGKSYGDWGAGGMLVVKSLKDEKKLTFYWNLKEVESAKIRDLDSGKAVDWNTYYADYFIVNGFGKDELKNDSISNIKGNVGDSLLIMIANSGRGIHSIHFHGYHCTAIHVNSSRVQKGANKDTFPLASGDGLMLLLVPDKPGIYPVHDHNLIAVTGGGKYPNGIFMMQVIK